MGFASTDEPDKCTSSASPVHPSQMLRLALLSGHQEIINLEEEVHTSP